MHGITYRVQPLRLRLHAAQHLVWEAGDAHAVDTWLALNVHTSLIHGLHSSLLCLGHLKIVIWDVRSVRLRASTEQAHRGGWIRMIGQHTHGIGLHWLLLACLWLRLRLLGNEVRGVDIVERRGHALRDMEVRLAHHACLVHSCERLRQSRG